MSSSYNLYKGNARKRRGKVAGESSQSLPKKARVEEPTTEVPPAVPVVEVAESPDRGTEAPRAAAADEPQVEVPFVPSPVEEVAEGGDSREVRQQIFDNVFKMTLDRAEKVHKNKKYLKASSSFEGYNFGSAFSRAANDITMVCFLFGYLP